MKFKPPSTSSLWTFGVFVFFSLVLFLFNWHRYHIQLTELTKLTDVLESADIERLEGRANPLAVVLHLRNSTERPGIFIGSSNESANNLAAKLQHGDTLTIYYNADGAEVSNRINLHTYQIETPTHIVYSFVQAKHRDEISLWCNGLFVIWLTSLWLFLLYIKKRKSAK